MKRLPLSTHFADPDALRIAIVLSRTNDFLTEKLCEGALSELRAFGVTGTVVMEVAGAFEIVAASAHAFACGYDGVVAIGVVIRGQTPHFEYISGAVTDGLTRLASEGKAVTFGILTVDNVQQASDRSGGPLGNKGAEAAAALLQLLSAFEKLPRQGRNMQGKPDAA
ncbi:MAG: 6,7-dimethyl-8-ribityllumazine synthase [Candidatus Hydrogenedentota bacterium]